jgi:hypothetical protein
MGYIHHSTSSKKIPGLAREIFQPYKKSYKVRKPALNRTGFRTLLLTTYFGVKTYFPRVDQSTLTPSKIKEEL